MQGGGGVKKQGVWEPSANYETYFNNAVENEESFVENHFSVHWKTINVTFMIISTTAVRKNTTFCNIRRAP